MRGLYGRGGSILLNREKQRNDRRHLMWRIEDLERGVEQAEDELEKTFANQRLSVLRDRLRRLGGPLEDDDYPF